MSRMRSMSDPQPTHDLVEPLPAEPVERVADIATHAELLTGADLVRLGRALPGVFDLELATAEGPVTLRCETLLRVLPGRRVVARASRSGQVVLAKLFVGPRAAVERQWEERGHFAFRRAGVATPEIVGGGTLAGGGEALLFEFLDDALPATEADLPQMMPILARLHAHGVVQNDLHLGNLLRTARGLFLIDGGGVSGMGDDKPLSLRASVRNLALFLAQFGIRAESGFVAAWHAYCVARGFKTIDADGRELLDAVHRARHKRVRAYMKKVLRDCSEFHAEQGFGYFLVCARASYKDGIEALIDNIDEQFERGRVIKAGNTVTVARLHVDGEPLVIKRYNIKSWHHAIGRMWRPTRAQRAWQNAHRLRMLGIATIQPVALIEHRFGALRRSAYLVMRDAGGVDLRERFESRHIRAVVGLFTDLFRAGLVHGDAKATNFIDVEGRIHLIDLDSMRAPRSQRALQRGISRDVDRFVENWDSATIRAALTRAFAPLKDSLTAPARRHR
jgi:tRNA A-37 threonylcarbamoyl transferase component Bud32